MAGMGAAGTPIPAVRSAGGVGISPGGLAAVLSFAETQAAMSTAKSGANTVGGEKNNRNKSKGGL